MFEINSEYTRIVAALRAQCSRNENPPEPVDPPAKAAAINLQRVKVGHFNSRKISLTCQSIKTTIGDTKPDPLLLDPLNKNAQRRLRSPLPSPLPSPASSPLPSPNRSRFQVKVKLNIQFKF